MTERPTRAEEVLTDRNWTIAEKVADYAAARGIALEVAIGWLASQDHSLRDRQRHHAEHGPERRRLAHDGRGNRRYQRPQRSAAPASGKGVAMAQTDQVACTICWKSTF